MRRGVFIDYILDKFDNYVEVFSDDIKDIIISLDSSFHDSYIVYVKTSFLGVKDVLFKDKLLFNNVKELSFSHFIIGDFFVFDDINNPKMSILVLKYKDGVLISFN